VGEATGIERAEKIPPASPVQVGVMIRIDPPLSGGVGRCSESAAYSFFVFFPHINTFGTMNLTLHREGAVYSLKKNSNWNEWYFEK
jgi:hypothetical protein